MRKRRPTALEVLAGRDLRERVFVVTGATSGIGLETAAALAACGGRVWLGCLSVDEGEGAADVIRERHPAADLRLLPCDLGDLRAVRAAADTVEPVVHALVCNAGVYGGPYAETVDGFERTVGVCYVGHAALVLALLDRLRAAAPGRVVLVSSDNHRWPRRLDFDRLPLSRSQYSELASYGQAKRCMVLLAAALERAYAPELHANALHPGDLVSTGIDGDSWVLRTVMGLARPFTQSAAQAAATSVHLATAPELEHVGGRYFVDRRERAPGRDALDPDIAHRLWGLTQRWIAEGRPIRDG